ncbi:MAG: S46 family peptidase, partial [Bacteroidota bacterium]
LIPEYYAKVPKEHQSFYVRDQATFAGGVQQLVQDLYQRSYLTKPDRVLKLMREKPETFLEVLKGDPGYQFVVQLNKFNEQRVVNPYNKYQERNAPLARQYMQALINFFPEKRFYPDANRTLRLSYGKFEGFKGLDGKDNHYMTYLDGVVDKYVPGDYEFDLPPKLLDLHKNKDYGRYATKAGKLPVCILGSNHTTGGNSGSPALDANGHLVGLNFDRTWQSTMSDVNYDPSICRNIMVDIRYVLFLIDKLGGAPHLVAEMTLVE